jgi:hypothetical protein
MVLLIAEGARRLSSIAVSSFLEERVSGFCQWSSNFCLTCMKGTTKLACFLHDIPAPVL